MSLSARRFRSVALLGIVFLIACAGTPEDRDVREDAIRDVPLAREASLELTLETDRGVYAPGDTVELALTLHNPGPAAVVLSFSDAQRYDFRILDRDGETVWRWSEDYAFAQVLGEERLAPAETREWRERYGGPLPSGRYTAKGTVPATDRPLRAETSFRVLSRRV